MRGPAPFYGLDHINTSAGSCRSALRPKRKPMHGQTRIGLRRSDFLSFPHCLSAVYTIAEIPGGVEDSDIF